MLERFHVKTPALLSDLREQIKDLELKEVEGFKRQHLHPYGMGKDERVEYPYTSGYKRRKTGGSDYDRRHCHDLYGSY